MAVSGKSSFVPYVVLCVLFFFSGCAALIYQVMWQRMLFTLLGVDLESITIVVSVFMFGLGVGGLIGGAIADRLRTKLLACYILIEFSVACFGFWSADIITGLGSVLAGGSEWLTVAASFLVLVVPTLLMGATFPILVTHINDFDPHIGRSVGSLYFANTLGGAYGAYLSGFVLLFFMGLSGAVQCAVTLNLAVALTAWLFFKGEKN